MSIFGFAKEFFPVVSYDLSSEKRKKAIQQKRLKDIVEYARANSSYYNKIIPGGVESFESIPPTTKVDFINNFDDIVVDKRITLEGIRRSIKERTESGDIMGGKYVLSMTSGSMGNPTVILQDQRALDRDSVSTTLRDLCFSFPIGNLVWTGSFGVAAARLKHNQGRSALLNKFLCIIDAKQSIADIADQLEKANVATLTGYTNTIRLAAAEIVRQGKTLNVKKVFCSGEDVTASDRAIVQKAFPKARVSSLYGCTEGGVMAAECKCGHLHIRSDLVKLEPVDRELRPVPYDVKADKVLLTHLSNRVQPLIRYVMDDRVTFHHGCPCGSTEDWLEIEGRTNDIMAFDTPNGVVEVAQMNMVMFMDKVSYDGLEKFKHYQIVLHPGNRLEFRLNFWDGVDHEAAFREVVEQLRPLMKIWGVEEYSCYLADCLPQTTTAGGKYKRIFCAAE